MLLKRTIESVLRQTFRNFKLCIYDNASGDETAEVVAQFALRDSRVHYHCHAENIGGTRNFQQALSRVDTPFFSFLSDDDFLLPGFLDTAVSGFHQCPEAGFSACAVIIMSAGGEILDVPMQRWTREGVYFPEQGLLRTIGRNAPIWTGIVFKHDATRTVGGLDVDTWIMDMDFVSRVASRFPYVVSKIPGAVYTAHERSSSAALQLSFYWPACLRGIQSIAADEMVPKPLRVRFEAMQKRYISRVLLNMGIKALETGNLETACAVARILKEDFAQHYRANALSVMSLNGRLAGAMRKALGLSMLARRRIVRATRRKTALQDQYGYLTGQVAKT